MSTRARITYPDGTTEVIRDDEASVRVYETGLVSITRGDRSRWIPPTSYKFFDIEILP